jgi:RNA polymerase sigma-70 factor (ECF subfamily)
MVLNGNVRPKNKLHNGGGNLRRCLIAQGLDGWLTLITEAEIEISVDASSTIRLATPPTKDKEDPSATVTPAMGGCLQAEASDEELMTQLGEGNSEALAILFRRYARAVHSIAYRAVRDGPEADDLVQDIFLLVHRDAKAFNGAKGPARAWIFQIAHRRAISRHRYLSSRHFYIRVDLDDLRGELGDPRPFIGRPGNSINEMFGETGFQRAFEELSSNQRETLRLHFFEGYTLAEIADKLGQSRGNIKHHYFRGLERLRKQLFCTRDAQMPR